MAAYALPTLQDHQRCLGIFLPQGPRGGVIFYEQGTPMYSELETLKLERQASQSKPVVGGREMAAYAATVFVALRGGSSLWISLKSHCRI